MKLIETTDGAWVNPDFVQTWTPVATAPGERPQYSLISAAGQSLGLTYESPVSVTPAVAAPAPAAEAAVKAKPAKAKPATGKARRGK